MVFANEHLVLRSEDCQCDGISYTVSMAYLYPYADVVELLREEGRRRDIDTCHTERNQRGRVPGNIFHTWLHCDDHASLQPTVELARVQKTTIDPD